MLGTLAAGVAMLFGFRPASAQLLVPSWMDDPEQVRALSAKMLAELTDEADEQISWRQEFYARGGLPYQCDAEGAPGPTKAEVADAAFLNTKWTKD